jgi:hypothetical protein
VGPEWIWLEMELWGLSLGGAGLDQFGLGLLESRVASVGWTWMELGLWELSSDGSCGPGTDWDCLVFAAWFSGGPGLDWSLN